LNGRDIHKTLEDANALLRPTIKTFEANNGKVRYSRKNTSVVDAELIKLLQFQGDDDGEADSLSVTVEEEIARRKAVGGRLQ
jgi:hypothetical protein